ncbi:MAG: transcription antitermination protein NusB [Spirulina sp. SIO3F2]|nr:transcription antitermination protein NusB [Spirulina sp. SIO3F2]
MPARKQPRRISRELAVLGLSHLSRNEAKLNDQLLHDFLWAAIQTLTTEARELLETAAIEIRRAREQFKSGQPLSPAERQTAQVAANEGLSLAETALERIGYALDLPEFTQIARQQDVRNYAIELLSTVHRRKAEIRARLNAALENWTLDRLPQLDRHILMLAIAEICYLNVPERVAINEAIELAKQYSDDEGARFINGVLRRVSNQLKNPTFIPAVEAPSVEEATTLVSDSGSEAPRTEVLNLAPPAADKLTPPQSESVLATPAADELTVLQSEPAPEASHLEEVPPVEPSPAVAQRTSQSKPAPETSRLKGLITAPTPEASKTEIPQPSEPQAEASRSQSPKPKKVIPSPKRLQHPKKVVSTPKNPSSSPIPRATSSEPSTHP